MFEHEHDYNKWVGMIQRNWELPPTKPPQRVKQKSSNLMVRTKKAITETVIISPIGKVILKEIIDEDMWTVLDTMKAFITKVIGTIQLIQI